MRRFLKLPLSQKLTILLCAFSLIPLTAAVWFHFKTAHRELEKLTRYQMEYLCADRKAELQNYFKSLRTNVEMLGDHRLIKDILAECVRAYDQEGGAGKAYEAVDAALRWRIVKLNRSYGFEDMLLVSTKGDVVLTAGKGPEWGTNLMDGLYSDSSLAHCFKMAKSETALVDFAPYPPSGSPAAFIGVPIINQTVRSGYEAGQKMGVLIVRIPAERINGIMHRETGLGKTGEIYLLGTDRLLRSGLRLEHTKTLLTPMSESDEVVEAFNGKSGYEDDFTDRRGVLVATTHTPAGIEGLDWIIVAKKDHEEIHDAFSSLRKRILLFSLLVGMVSVAAALFFLRGIISPLSRMRLAAARIASGNLAERIEIEEYGHVGKLAAAFNEMTGHLEESRSAIEQQNRDLEQTVEERTAELKRQTEELEKSNHALLAHNELLRILNTEVNLDSLLAQIVEGVVRRTGVQVMALYLYDENRKALLPAATYGIDRERIPTAFKLGSGIPGQVAVDRKAVLLSAVPEDYLRVSSAVLDGAPRNVMYIPVSFGNELIGVLEMGSVHDFSASRKEFIEAVVSQIGIGLHNALAHGRLKTLSEELQDKNELLMVQNEELQSQNEEIQGQAEELQAQTEELEAQRIALEDKSRMVMEANRLKSEFVSNMSHELRTPLNAILGMTRLFIGGTAGKVNDKQAEYLDVIERNGRNLLLLINDILDLSRIESGQMEVSMAELSLHNLITDMVRSSRHLLEEKGLTLNIDIGGSVRIWSDAEKLKQIITNLLSNAIKFTDRGTITISAGEERGPEQDLVLISVADTGMGIPEDSLECIFDAFRQVDGSITRRHGGTGLGLHICRKLVEMLQGKIEVVSRPGEGSTFTAVMPKDARRQQTDTEDLQRKIRDALFSRLDESEVGQGSGSEGTGDILLIDDDPIVARELSMIMEEGCGSLRIAFDGPEGLREMEKRLPDLLLLDLNMPGMDGFAVLDELKKHAALKKLPVIILTARDLTGAEMSRFPGNVKSVIIKGQVNRQVFLDEIAKVFQRKPLDARGTTLPPEPASRAASSVQPAGTGGPFTVMVVEDSEDNMVFITEALKPAGYIVHAASDGRQAVETAARQKPDIILMDIHLPVLSGYEATRQIRSSEGMGSIPIIALTAMAMKGDRERVLTEGFDDYLSKPVHPGDLIRKIEEWLERRGKHGNGSDRMRK